MTTIEVITTQTTQIQAALATLAMQPKPVPPDAVATIGRTLIEKLYEIESGGEGLLSSLVMSSSDAPLPVLCDDDDDADEAENDRFQPVTRAALDAYIAKRAAPNWSRWLRSLR